MRIALVLTPLSDHHLRLAAQVGATDVVARYPGTDLDGILRLRDRIASFGLRLSVVEGYIPYEKAVHGRPGRDAQIADFITLLRHMGRAGIGLLCYNWMPDNDWSRTSFADPERGGALVTGFDAETLRDAPVSPNGAIRAEALWENLEYFLRRVVPAAEEAGVRLAMHPDDAPVPHLRGQDRIFCTVEAFERLVELVPSPANGVCFCQGTFATIGVDIPAAIRRLGPHIRYVHFRDVRGTPAKFRETFHDNGQTDMAAAMRAYREIGYTGLMRPDHVPTLDGEPNDHPGYAMLGRLFAVGYMRGLMHATEPVA